MIAWRQSIRLSPLVVCLVGTAAQAQGFGVPGSTPVRERVTGSLIPGESLSPEAGDQVAILFDGEPAGVQTFQSGDDLSEFSVLVFGDDPNTEGIVEGPRFNEVGQVAFYDSSTDTVRTDVRLENSAGEPVTYRYRGEEVPDLPIELPGLDLTPVRSLNLRLGAEPNPGGGDGDDDGGDGGDGGPTRSLDVNADGRVETSDAAIILRIVTGARSSVTSDDIDRADVDGDGVVTTRDAIEVLRGR